MPRRSSRLADKKPHAKDADKSASTEQNNGTVDMSPELLARRKKKRGGKRNIDMKEILQDELGEGAQSQALEKKPASTKAKKSTIQKKVPVLEERLFEVQDQADLCEDEHKRFLYPSNLIGHALVGVKADGSFEALQYKAPGTLDPDQPEVVHLNNIQLVDKFGALRAEATTDTGERMVSKRSIKVGTNVGEEYAEKRLYFFSPAASHTFKGDVFWGSDEQRQPSLFRDDLDDDIRADLEAEMAEIKSKSRGGKLEIVHKDVPVRDGMKRKPDQNTVMKGSAINAYEDFLESHSDELSDDMKAILKKSVAARNFLSGGGPKSQPRPEWLHALGYGLYPIKGEGDPQRKSNLAAAPKYLNTKMMVTERTLKWHALHRPDAKLTLDVNFNMLYDSDLLKEGYIQGEIEENGNTVTLKQHLNPFTKYPIYPKTTDIMQTTMVTQGILQGNEAETSKVRAGSSATIKQKLLHEDLVAATATTTKTKEGSMAKKKITRKVAQERDEDSLSETEVDNLDVLLEEELREAPSVLATAGNYKIRRRQVIEDDLSDDDDELTDLLDDDLEASLDQSESLTEVDELDLSETESESKSEPLPAKVTSKSKKSKSPYERSVVQIYSTFQYEDYEAPWKGTEPHESTGSGFVYERNGKHYLLTNAHVVEGSNYLEVRLANDSKRYTAKPLQVSYQADIAILEVEDPEFQHRTKPVELGEMVAHEQKVKVVGFPMGGDEISVTKGINSRIQVDEYAEGGERNLQVQTDSAINPGNSGGPVFSDGKLVGIAFQGIGEGEGLGYYIPIPVIEHFLTDYFSPGPYQGFPSLNIAFQTLGNDNLRTALGMKANQSGVRINRIDLLSDAFDKLKEGDILCAIDGHKVSNDGKVDIKGIAKRLELSYAFSSKYIGDNVTLSVLRPNKAGKLVKRDIDVTLKYRAAGTKVIEGYEFEKPPTYYATAGLMFQPVTMNYLETQHGHQLREMVDSRFGYLADMPKQKPGQQLVVINRIFASANTKGYEFFENNAVKEVNGQEINNMLDLVQAFESNKKAFHMIKVADGEIIAVKNLSLDEDKALFSRYRVKDLCSDDIKPHLLRKTAKHAGASLARAVGREHVESITREEVVELKSQMAQLMALLGGGAQAQAQAPSASTNQLSRYDFEQEPSDGEDILSDETESFDEDDYENDGFIVDDGLLVEAAPVVAFSGRDGAVGDGGRRYLQRLAEMEERYGWAEARNLGKEEISSSEDCLSVSISETESDVESANDSVPTPPRRSARLRSRK